MVLQLNNRARADKVRDRLESLPSPQDDDDDDEGYKDSDVTNLFKGNIYSDESTKM